MAQPPVRTDVRTTAVELEVRHIGETVAELRNELHEKADRGELSKDVVKDHDARLRVAEESVRVLLARRTFSLATYGPLLLGVLLAISAFLGFVRSNDLSAIQSNAYESRRILEGIASQLKGLDERLTAFREEQIRTEGRLTVVERKTGVVK